MFKATFINFNGFKCSQYCIFLGICEAFRSPAILKNWKLNFHHFFTFFYQIFREKIYVKILFQSCRKYIEIWVNTRYQINLLSLVLFCSLFRTVILEKFGHVSHLVGLVYLRCDTFKRRTKCWFYLSISNLMPQID